VPKATKTFHFEAIGTLWDIRLSQDIDELQHLYESIHDRIEEFDTNYSRFRSDSFVTKVSKKPGSYVLPNDAEPLFDLYDQLSKLTNGNMNPLVGHLLEDAGYDADYSLKPKSLRSVPKWSEVVEYNYPKLVMKTSSLIDVGAAGKGYLIDIIASIIEAAGIDTFSINAGGDILYRTSTKEAERIGLENPDDLEQVIGVASIHNQSICGSAGNRRAWGSFNHIIDPTLQSSPTHIKAVWVIAETALIADGLTTALYFASAAQLQREFAFEYAIINEDNSLHHSKHFPAEFFTE
jgi:thiamine biosynthesis lipoprotein